MSFSDRLNKIIEEQDAINDVSRMDVIRIQKMVVEFNNVSDKVVRNIDDLKKIFTISGLDNNEIMKPFMDQLDMLSNGLKENGNLRKSFEGMLSVSKMIGK